MYVRKARTKRDKLHKVPVVRNRDDAFCNNYFYALWVYATAAPVVFLLSML